MNNGTPGILVLFNTFFQTWQNNSILMLMLSGNAFSVLVLTERFRKANK